MQGLSDSQLSVFAFPSHKNDDRMDCQDLGIAEGHFVDFDYLTCPLKFSSFSKDIPR